MKAKNEVAISIKDLFISYRDIKKFSIRKTLFSREKTTLYTAVRGVSFDIKKGEIVARVPEADLINSLEKIIIEAYGLDK